MRFSPDRDENQIECLDFIEHTEESGLVSKTAAQYGFTI
jgi:hypothetical protein